MKTTRLRGVAKARQEEREAAAYMAGDAVPTKGFCHECESFVDELAGKLHRATCRGVSAERRRAS